MPWLWREMARIGPYCQVRANVFGYLKTRGAIYREAAAYDSYGREVRCHLEHGEWHLPAVDYQISKIRSKSSLYIYTYTDVAQLVLSFSCGSNSFISLAFAYSTPPQLERKLKSDCMPSGTGLWLAYSGTIGCELRLMH